MTKSNAEGSASKRTKPRRRNAAVGRPASVVTKKRWISFRLTDEEFFRIADKAQRSGMSHVEYARSRALAGIARRRKQMTTAPIFGEATAELYHELRKQGVNLNQIAHHCNTLQVPPPDEVRQLATVIMALWQRLLAT